jgi:hypothetical protein
MSLRSRVRAHVVLRPSLPDSQSPADAAAKATAGYRRARHPDAMLTGDRRKHTIL